MKKLVFFKCNNCGNVVVKLVDNKTKLFCCGEEMVELKANSQDASQEKHLPVIDINNSIVKVSVGSVLHPMAEDHFINFIVVETNKGYKVANLIPQSNPEAIFVLDKDEKVLNVYEYCNLHGLWVVNK